MQSFWKSSKRTALRWNASQAWLVRTRKGLKPSSKRSRSTSSDRNTIACSGSCWRVRERRSRKRHSIRTYYNCKILTMTGTQKIPFKDLRAFASSLSMITRRLWSLWSCPNAQTTSWWYAVKSTKMGDFLVTTVHIYCLNWECSGQHSTSSVSFHWNAEKTSAPPLCKSTDYFGSSKISKWPFFGRMWPRENMG